MNSTKKHILLDEVFYRGAWVKRADLPKIKKAEREANKFTKVTGFNKYRGYQ